MSVKIDINEKGLKLENPEGSKVLKPKTPDTWLAMSQNGFEFDVIWTAFQLFLKLHSHISVLWCFCRISVIFRVFAFGYRAQNENLEITENLYFQVYDALMHMDLFFDHSFNSFSVKINLNKKGLYSICPEGSKDFKTQIAAAWWAMLLNHFEIDVIWEAFQEFLKLHSHISVFRGFW